MFSYLASYLTSDHDKFQPKRYLLSVCKCNDALYISVAVQKSLHTWIIGQTFLASGHEKQSTAPQDVFFRDFFCFGKTRHHT